MEIREKDNLVKQSIKNKRLENLTKKQAEKSKIEQERPTYYFMVVASKLIQLLTALLASCGFYAFLNDFIHNPTVILIVCIIALAWMEHTIGKNFSIISINKLLAREQHFSIIALSVFLVALCYNMVNSYVQNRRQPSIETLFKIAKILNVEAKELLTNNPIQNVNI